MLNREQRELVERMGGLPLLGELTEEERRALAKVARRVTLPDGWSFVHEGTPADACYIVLDGEARVCVDQHEVSRVGPGELIGEVALLQAGLRSASVTSTSRMELLHIEYATLTRLLEHRPHLYQVLLDSYRRHQPLAESPEQSRPAVEA